MAMIEAARTRVMLMGRTGETKRGEINARTPVKDAKPRAEIEYLLQWAYRDELPKRHTSSAEDNWGHIKDYGELGGVNPHTDHSPQRYDYGLPHPDAERIEKAVPALEDLFMDWDASRDAVMGDLTALLQSRDVLLLRPLKTAALVTMHSKMGTRPDWFMRVPRPCMVEPARGPKSQGKVVGECRGKNLYTTGSYCPLRWEPSPIEIAIARAEYAAWHRGLTQLSETLLLEKFSVLPPAVSSQPWLKADLQRKIYAVGEHRKERIPLKPQRDTIGSGRRVRRASAVRKISVD